MARGLRARTSWRSCWMRVLRMVSLEEYVLSIAIKSERVVFSIAGSRKD